MIILVKPFFNVEIDYWSIIDYLLFGFTIWDPYSEFGWLGALWIILNLLPYFSINNRRLLDTGKGNWKIKPPWLLPIIFIFLQILLVLFIIIGWIISKKFLITDYKLKERSHPPPPL